MKHKLFENDKNSLHGFSIHFLHKFTLCEIWKGCIFTFGTLTRDYWGHIRYVLKTIITCPFTNEKLRPCFIDFVLLTHVTESDRSIQKLVTLPHHPSFGISLTSSCLRSIHAILVLLEQVIRTFSNPISLQVLSYTLCQYLDLHSNWIITQIEKKSLKLTMK